MLVWLEADIFRSSSYNLLYIATYTGISQELYLVRDNLEPEAMLICPSFGKYKDNRNLQNNVEIQSSAPVLQIF